MEEPGAVPLVVDESPHTSLWGDPGQSKQMKGLHCVLRTRQGARRWDPEEEQPGLRRELQPMPLEPKLMEETTVPALSKPPPPSRVPPPRPHPPTPPPPEREERLHVKIA